MDLGEDEFFFLPHQNYEEFFGTMINNNPAINKEYAVTLGTEPFINGLSSLDFCKAYGIRYVEGGIAFKQENIFDYMDAIITKELNKDLMQLVKMGLVDYYWDSEKEDFIFKTLSKE